MWFVFFITNIKQPHFMGIIDLLKGIEKLAVELLLWFIYVPKTIYKIIKDPNWVPVYVHDELTKEDKFKGYMSPVLLFLGITVVLFVLLDSGVITSPDYDQKSISFSERIQDVVGLLFLTIPLFFALFTEIFRNGGLKKEALMQNLYVQCYYLSPVMLSLFAYLIADQFDWESTGTYINVSQTPLYLFSLTVLWFVIVQVKYISAELRYKKVISLGIVLLWVMIIGAGLSTSESLFTPVIVDKGGIGEKETLTMTLPKDDEYLIDVFNYSDGYINDYTISLVNNNSKANKDSLGIPLIHNQFHIDTVKNQLRFWFNGNKGDYVGIQLSNLVSSPESQIGLYTKKPGDDLLWDAQRNPTELWYMEFDENNNPYFLGLYDLPESGKYHLLFNGLINIGQEYSVGFFKNDHYGAYQNEDVGKISYGNKHSGLSSDNTGIGFNKWKFKGKRGEIVEIQLTPSSIHDVGFDVIGSNGESVVPIDKTTVANVIHWLYVILFGYIIIIGFRAFFRPSTTAVVINQNDGSKTGKILAIIALVVTALTILMLFIAP